MENFHCSTSINAKPEKVYQALTQEKGLRNWWTETCTAEQKVGGKATFHFGKSFNTMQIAHLDPNHKVEWKCIDQHHASTNFSKNDEWIGTRLIFQLKSNAQGGTDLDFTHEGLNKSLECYDACFKGWTHFIKTSLKNYLETGHGKPYTEANPTCS